jgi:hypothetical protein
MDWTSRERNRYRRVHRQIVPENDFPKLRLHRIGRQIWLRPTGGHRCLANHLSLARAHSRLRAILRQVGDHGAAQRDVRQRLRSRLEGPELVGKPGARVAGQRIVRPSSETQAIEAIAESRIAISPVANALIKTPEPPVKARNLQ